EEEVGIARLDLPRVLLQHPAQEAESGRAVGRVRRLQRDHAGVVHDAPGVEPGAGCRAAGVPAAELLELLRPGTPFAHQRREHVAPAAGLRPEQRPDELVLLLRGRRRVRGDHVGERSHPAHSARAVPVTARSAAAACSSSACARSSRPTYCSCSSLTVPRTSSWVAASTRAPRRNSSSSTAANRSWALFCHRTTCRCCCRTRWLASRALSAASPATRPSRTTVSAPTS